MTHARVGAALAAFVVLSSLLSSSGPVRAECGGGPSLAETYASAVAVFVGRATSIARESHGVERIGEQEWEHVELVATFEVEETIKGEAAKSLVVSLGEDTAESLRVEEGHKYLIVAGRDAGGRLASGACGLSGPLEGSAANVAFFRYVARFGRPPAVVGRLGENTPTESTLRSNDDAPLGGAGVTLEGGVRRFETVTDRDGGFVFADAPKGVYTAKLSLPDGYRLTSFTSTGIEQKAGASVVRVGAACAVVYATATRGGAVTGRFLDASGKPVVGYDLALVPSDRLQRASFADLFALTRTEDDGRFRFDPVPPGDYALVANWPPMPKIDVPPRPSFVVAKAPDVVVTYTVAAGRETSTGDLKAPVPPAYVTLDVEVVDEKGSPVNFAVLVFSDEKGKPFGITHTEEGGRVHVYLPAEHPCSVRIQNGGGTAEPIAIDPAKVGSTLRIVAEPSPAH